MAQQSRVGTVATTVTQNPLRVTYHQTIVVALTPKGVRLDSGGWRTSTTKTRMNQASREYGLGFSVFQKDHDWFVEHGGKTRKFQDGMILAR